MKKILRNAIIVYFLTWLGSFLFVVIAVVVNDRTLWNGVTIFVDLVPNASFLKGFHLFFVFIFGLFLLLRYMVRSLRNKGFKVFLKRLVLHVLVPVGFMIFTYKTLIYFNTREDFNYAWDNSVENQAGVSNNCYSLDGKHRGMSVFGWRQENPKAIHELVKNNVEWVAVIPYISQKDERTVAMNIRDSYDNWSRRDSVRIRAINALHDKGIHVQLKPHLWVNSGWRSNINFDDKDHWDTWFDSYRINILHYAKMAQETNVELLCIGTELRTSVTEQPEKWQALIREIKTIYKGKLTYAANWNDDYEAIAFWDQLDYIGIQAYFPLTQTKNPDLETIKNGWDIPIARLQGLSHQYNKPILFTEVGYKSEASSTIKPWEWENGFGVLYQKKSDRTQVLAFEALFQKLWAEEWFAGMYIWQWDTRSSPDLTERNLNFSPRFKPAENIIAKWYSMY